MDYLLWFIVGVCHGQPEYVQESSEQCVDIGGYFYHFYKLIIRMHVFIYFLCNRKMHEMTHNPFKHLTDYRIAEDELLKYN